MDRLSPLDNAFLEAEDADPHVSMAMASIAIFEGPAPTYEEFVAAIAGRLVLVPRFRQKVRRVPFDLGAPVWVDDPDFELRWHIQPADLPAPGGEEGLRELMGRVMGLRMDRTRPLWQYWLVGGLPDGKWAVISKVHHCMVDGIAGTDLYRAMLDLSPEPPPLVLDQWAPGPEPSTLSLLGGALRTLVASPGDQVRAIAGLVRRPGGAVRSVADAGKGLLRIGEALRPASSSTLCGEIGHRRRYTWARASLDDVREIRRDVGGTVNDVVLTAITAGFRDLLISRGEAPKARSVRTLVPVSIRPPGAEGVADNEVTMLLAWLPVHLADPAERLAAVREELARLKASKEAEAGTAMTSMALHEPFPLVSLPVRAAFKVAQRSLVTVTTNVPGPPFPLYGLGRRVLEIAPYVPIANTLRIGVAIFSYDGSLTFGITGDHDSTPDLDVLARGIERGLADLLAAARETARARSSPVDRLTLVLGRQDRG